MNPNKILGNSNVPEVLILYKCVLKAHFEINHEKRRMDQLKKHSGKTN